MSDTKWKKIKNRPDFVSAEAVLTVATRNIARHLDDMDKKMGRFVFLSELEKVGTETFIDIETATAMLAKLPPTDSFTERLERTGSYLRRLPSGKLDCFLDKITYLIEHKRKTKQTFSEFEQHLVDYFEMLDIGGKQVSEILDSEKSG